MPQAWAYLTAYDAATHTVDRPQDSGAPGAPSKSLDVFAMDVDLKTDEGYRFR